MNNFPTDPETGVCLSGGLASLSRQPAVTSQTDRPGYSDPGDTREEGNIGSIITMLITDQVRKYDRCLAVLSVETITVSILKKCKQFDSKFRSLESTKYKIHQNTLTFIIHFSGHWPGQHRAYPYKVHLASQRRTEF